VRQLLEIYVPQSKAERSIRTSNLHITAAQSLPLSFLITCRSYPHTVPTIHTFSSCFSLSHKPPQQEQRRAAPPHGGEPCEESAAAQPTSMCRWSHALLTLHRRRQARLAIDKLASPLTISRRESCASLSTHRRSPRVGGATRRQARLAGCRTPTSTHHQRPRIGEATRRRIPHADEHEVFVAAMDKHAPGGVACRRARIDGGRVPSSTCHRR
jgi:hypothetical protein